MRNAQPGAGRQACSSPGQTSFLLSSGAHNIYLIIGHYFVTMLSTVRTVADISHNMRVKIYPDGSKTFLLASRDIFREAGYEVADFDKDFSDFHCSCSRSVSESNIQRSQRRARVAVADYALSNSFKYFVTLTLDAARIDRYDIKEITRKLKHWLDNCVRRRGLKYILVPEYHKDGALHYHGFFNDALPAVDSGAFTKDGKIKKPRSATERAMLLESGWQIVYNLQKWTLGFSTAIELYGDKHAAVNYVCKYITKSDIKIGGRWYYSGGDLKKPKIELYDADFSAIEPPAGAHRYTIAAANAEFITWSEGVQDVDIC